MKKTKDFLNTRFPADVFRETIDIFHSQRQEAKDEVRFMSLVVRRQDTIWQYDSIDEFLADYRGSNEYARIQIECRSYAIGADMYSDRTSIGVEAPNRAVIERLFEPFEKAAKSSLIPTVPPAAEIKPVVFIGHGRSPMWRDLKDFLQDKHHIKVISFESGARAGHGIRDILQEMVSASSFAILVLTAEDNQADGNTRARQNVIHEAGLFQGRLGFSKAILVVEEDVEVMSNVDGIWQIRFGKGNIRETYGEILATLRREFGSI